MRKNRRNVYVNDDSNDSVKALRTLFNDGLLEEDETNLTNSSNDGSSEHTTSSHDSDIYNICRVFSICSWNIDGHLLNENKVAIVILINQKSLLQLIYETWDVNGEHIQTVSTHHCGLYACETINAVKSSKLKRA